MPELPEVQTIVSDLNKKVRGRRIVGVWFDWPKMITIIFADKRGKLRGTTRKIKEFKKLFEKEIKGKKIIKIERRAKNILIYLSDNFLMLVHLKMTGHLIVGRWRVERKAKSEKRKVVERVIPLEPREAVEDPYNQYIHLIFYLDNGKMIGFSDVRKFGKILLGTKEQIENLPELKNLGPEPLDKSFTVEKFKEALRQARGRKIKQVLMDPQVIAGIGNIYSDDILWKAKVHPLKPADKLNVKELNGLWKAMREILSKAVKLRGTSTSDYRDTAGKEGYYADYRLVYQREGEPCRRCGVKIKRIMVGGRSAHFCPSCQKL